MACKSCQQYKKFSCCLVCGKILHPISENIQRHHNRLEKMMSKITQDKLERIGERDNFTKVNYKK